MSSTVPLVTVAYSAPWDLRQRGVKDSLRHDERVKEAIKKNLKELIAQEDIISSDGTRRVRFPIRYLDQYRFKYGHPQQGAGQGAGNIGDILWQPGQQGSDPGPPGDQPGEHGYDVDVSLDELTRMMLDDLALPWLEAKPAAQDIAADDVEWTDRRKRGMPGNLDKRQTARENAKRNAARGAPGVHDFRNDDLRYKAWRVQTEPITSAAVYLCMDWSGSMTAEKKYLAKAVSFWIVQFLRLKYQRTELTFIAHDTEAGVVSEHDFFGRSAGGGTKCSSAYAVALQEMSRRHPRSRWNIFLWHFSDGENIDADNLVCKQRIEDLLQECTMVAYAEIAWQQSSHTIHQLLQTLHQITHPRFVTTVIKTREDIQRTLRTFLGAEIGARSP